MVYVDSANIQFGRMKMCHMIADTEEELHEMAKKIGMKRSWFQETSHPHYDVSLSKKSLALELGAKEIDSKELVGIIQNKRGKG